jgi:Protein of unknown function (DUF3298).
MLKNILHACLTACFLTLLLHYPTVFAGEVKKTARQATTVEVSYPYFDNKKIDADLQEWLSENALAMLDGEPSAISFDMEEDSLTVEISYETHYPSEKVVSLEFEIFRYPLHAAHPMTFIITRHYNLESGESLELDNLFADPDKALSIIAGQAKEKTREYMNLRMGSDYDDSDASLLEDGWFTEGSAPTRDNYSDLILLPDSIKVVFQQYQVLPYVFGLVEYTVPISDLEAAGPNAEVWPIK